MMSAHSNSVVETLLRREAERRNEVAQFDAFIAHCRAAFPLASEVATLSLAQLVALDLLVVQRWCKIDVGFVPHDATKGCFIGWQHPDSPAEVVVPVSSTAKTQTPGVFRSLIATAAALLPNCSTATLAIVATDSTIVYYKCSSDLLRDPNDIINATQANANDDDDDVGDDAATTTTSDVQKS